MTKSFRRNIKRTITKSLGRYFAIMAIIALGVGFFAGLKTTKPSMLSSTEKYMNTYRLYDFRVLSTIGFTAEEVKQIQELEGVSSAEGAISSDIICVTQDGSEKVLKAYSVLQGINGVELIAGRNVEASNECVVDAQAFDEESIGQQLRLSTENHAEDLEQFAYDEYTIVGIVKSPLYLNSQRGTTTLGSGTLNGFLYLLPSGFEYEYYNELYLTIPTTGAIYSDEYNSIIDASKERIEPEVKRLIQKRFDDLVYEGQVKIEEAKKELEEAKSRLDTAREQLEEGEEAYRQNLAEYEKSLKERDSMLEAANLKIEESQAELDSMEKPEVYLFGRDSNNGYASFENDSQIVEGIAKVFPVFFFLIAALVCSTTMTRMIDDERSQIGTFFAIGYSKPTILLKYLIYSGSAAIIGCLLGFGLGSYLFPKAIWKAYQMLYRFGDITPVPQYPLLLISLIAALLCSAGTTYAVCRNELRNYPANLIRPKAPEAGKRILMERIGFVWKRMKFLHKVSARNIFRFKKRMFMMILGISGCTALVLTGFGISDSISNIANYQFGDIMQYDISVIYRNAVEQAELDKLEETYGDKMESDVLLSLSSVDVRHKRNTKSVYLIVTDDEKIQDAVQLTSYGKDVSYPQTGSVVLTQKLAALLDAQIGDTVEVSIGNEMAKVVVSGLTENYVYNYVYMNRETYETYLSLTYEPKTLYITVSEGEDVYQLAAKIGREDDVMSVNIMKDLRNMVDDMMNSLDYVVLLVIACAGALAFVVLFNLGNINISERVREIATIKVLGFHSNETGAYVFRENLVLSILGIIVGLPLGILLHRFVMEQIQLDMVTFKVIIAPSSFLYSIVTVLVFTLITDLIMRRKIDGIDMTESLKSIE